jgi:hypothetical protein
MSLHNNHKGLACHIYIWHWTKFYYKFMNLCSQMDFHK